MDNIIVTLFSIENTTKRSCYQFGEKESCKVSIILITPLLKHKHPMHPDNQNLSHIFPIHCNLNHFYNDQFDVESFFWQSTPESMKIELVQGVSALKIFLIKVRHTCGCVEMRINKKITMKIIMQFRLKFCTQVLV